MTNALQPIQRFKVRWVLLLLITSFMGCLKDKSQNKTSTSVDTLKPVSIEIKNTLKSTTIQLNDTLNLDTQDQAFFKRILQSLKFRQNRNNKERDRVHAFLDSLMKHGDLKQMDSIQVQKLIEQYLNENAP